MVSTGIHRRFRHPYPVSTPAIFLDRDGVIVEETGYLHRIADVRLIESASAAIAAWNMANTPVVVVTNQAGIARGYFGWPEFVACQQYIELQLRARGAVLDGVWACGFHPEGTGVLASDHSFRKPNPGMLQDAATEMNLNVNRSWLIGDKTIDIQAGIAAGVAGAILVRTGYGAEMEPEVRSLPASPCAVYVADTLLDAAVIIHEHRQL